MNGQTLYVSGFPDTLKNRIHVAFDNVYDLNKIEIKIFDQPLYYFYNTVESL